MSEPTSNQDEPARRRVGLVVNPERDDLADRVVAGLGERGCDVVRARPDRAEDLPAAVGELLSSDVDVISAIGGDGTQRTVAMQLAESGSEVPMAVVPGGTVNLLAQVLGVDEIEVALDAACHGRAHRIDLGRMDDDRSFVLNSSTGWDASTIEAVDDGAKRFGRFGYAFVGLREWRRAPARLVTVTLDGRRWFTGDAKTVLILNAGQRGSSSFAVAPDAELDDGRLDVVVIRSGSLVGLLRTGLAIVRGVALPSADGDRAQAERIEVEWESDVAVQVDGDDVGSGHRWMYTSVPSAVAVLLPPHHAAPGTEERR